MKGELIFVLGGSASGKSRFAVSLAKKKDKNVLFVATCNPQDSEMKEKIRKHKKERPSHWKTIDASSTPFQIKWSRSPAGCVLVDSLTLWVSTLLIQGCSLKKIKKMLITFLNQARSKCRTMIIVSDEVGGGIVPESRVARDFREVLGAINQIVAQRAENVFCIISGLPIQLK